ncbi:MAG: nucleotidyltransferase [Polyangiaceae bacterium]|nr:nucleotidyltransferase [Polyangiaceae bacterium]
MSRPAAARLLVAFDCAMRAAGRRWYVFGALAAVAYGRPRMTADVDITVELRGAGARRLLTELAPYGFTLRIPLSKEHLAETQLLPMVHAPTELPLDLVIAGPGLDDEFLARANLVDIGGLKVPMISVEDLIAVKVLAGRRKDLEDVRGVLVEQHGRIDLARIHDVLAALEDAIGERTLLRRLSRLRRAADAEASAPQPLPRAPQPRTPPRSKRRPPR